MFEGVIVLDEALFEPGHQIHSPEYEEISILEVLYVRWTTFLKWCIYMIVFFLFEFLVFLNCFSVILSLRKLFRRFWISGLNSDPKSQSILLGQMSFCIISLKSLFNHLTQGLVPLILLQLQVFLFTFFDHLKLNVIEIDTWRHNQSINELKIRWSIFFPLQLVQIHGKINNQIIFHIRLHKVHLVVGIFFIIHPFVVIIRTVSFHKH